MVDSGDQSKMPVMAENVTPPRYEVHPLENSEPRNGRSSYRSLVRHGAIVDAGAAPLSGGRGPVR